MRQNKHGSILLYVLFLSSFLVLFFISFQGELEEMLDGAKSSESDIRDISSVQDALILLKNTPSEITPLNFNPSLSLTSLQKKGTVFSESLGKNATKEYWITSTGGVNSITLTLIAWWPISYHIAAFNSGSESSSSLISSGVVSTTAIISLSPSLDTHILVLESLGGFTQYDLDANTATILPEASSYRLERDINGYKKEEWIYDVSHFTPHSRAGFDYGKMGMYLDF